ncbi:MAG: ATP-binding protein, partial [Gammaproteobacteria bacterium]
MQANAANLESALAWLKNLIEGCFKMHFKQTEGNELSPLTLYNRDSWLFGFIEQYEPSQEEFAVLMLAAVPHLHPAFFTKLIAEHLPEGGDFPEFGGVKGSNHRGILPTGETAQFILAGDDLENRLAIQHILSHEHWLARQRIVWLESVPEGEPAMSGRLILNPEIVEWLTLGTVSKPRFSMDFPAEYIETDMVWDDLVLPPGTKRQIREIENWIRYNATVMQEWGMKK